MTNSLYREFYKFGHRKLTWFAPLIMLGFMLLMAGYPSAHLLTMMTYESSDAIMLVLVIVGSTMFSTEFQNNGILTLLYKSPRKIDVYLAKLITLLVYDLELHVLALIMTVIMTLTFKPISWTTVYQYGQPLWLNMFSATGVDMVSSTLIISLICLTSTLIKSNAVVITINIVIVFFGPGISANLMNYHSPLKPFVKWNPFNMTPMTAQYANYTMYHLTTLLTNQEILIGTFIYIAVFLTSGYLIFRKKRF